MQNSLSSTDRAELNGIIVSGEGLKSLGNAKLLRVFIKVDVFGRFSIIYQESHRGTTFSMSHHKATFFARKIIKTSNN